jgi:hypothetical protein
MKRIIIGILTLTLGIGIGLYITLLPNELLAFTANEPEDRLPVEATNYIRENFPNTTIVDVDLELGGYEVYLSNGVIIDFTLRGTVDWIEYGYTESSYSSYSDDTIISVELLPERFQSYLETNYPLANVLQVERDDDGYDVYLSTGYRIEFDLDGSIRKVNARP